MGRPGIKARSGKLPLCPEPDARFGVKMRAFTNRAPASAMAPNLPYAQRREPGVNPAIGGTNGMKTRVIIEYDLPRSGAAGAT